MNRFLAVVILSGSLAGSIQTIRAQGTLADYVRAGALRQKYLDAAPNVPELPHWVDASHFWYRKTAPGGHEFVMVETSTGAKHTPFDHEKLAASLARESGQKYTRVTLPFGGPAVPARGEPTSTLTFVDKDQAIEFDAAEFHWKCSLGDYSCKKTEADGRTWRSPRDYSTARNARGAGPARESASGVSGWYY